MFNLGLHDEDRAAALHLGDQTHMTNTVFAGAPFNSSRTEAVALRNATAQLQEIGVEQIDILKIDTEVCEVPILRELLRSYEPRCVHFEYHSEPDRRELDAMLTADYILFSGTALKPHIGLSTYVRNDAFPSSEVRDRWSVSLDRSGRG